MIKQKTKYGVVDRINDSRNILIRDLFQKETAPDIYLNLEVTLTKFGIIGKIIGSFGKSGKLKVRLDDELPEEQDEILGSEVVLKYKKSVWSDKKAKNKFKFN